MRAMCADAIEEKIEQLVLNGGIDPNTGRVVQITDKQAKSFIRSFGWHYPDLKPKKRKKEITYGPVIKHELDAVVFACSKPRNKRRV